MALRLSTIRRSRILRSLVPISLSMFLLVGPALLAARAAEGDAQDDLTTLSAPEDHGPPGGPPGQGECEHGNSGQECKPDPQPDHGQDCDEHGNSGGVNEDHCSPSPSPTPSPDPEPSESPDPEPSESPDPEPSESPDPEPRKIMICHIPPGNPENAQTIEIDEDAWPAHEAHGDTLGPCPSPSPSESPSESPDETPTTPPPPVDVCPNVEGDQAEVPDGYVTDGQGNCVPEEEEETPTTPPPSGSTTTPPPTRTSPPAPTTPPPSGGSSTPTAPVAGETVTNRPPRTEPSVAPQTVTPPGGLAFTGPADTTMRLSLVALALLVAGTGLMFAAHRIRRRFEA